jgi:hypothetical protein
MNEQAMVELLQEALEVWTDDLGTPDDEEVEFVGTFQDVGLMTSNKGLVVRVGDSEFQVTVVRSR